MSVNITASSTFSRNCSSLSGDRATPTTRTSSGRRPLQWRWKSRAGTSLRLVRSPECLKMTTVRGRAWLVPERVGSPRTGPGVPRTGGVSIRPAGGWAYRGRRLQFGVKVRQVPDSRTGSTFFPCRRGQACVTVEPEGKQRECRTGPVLALEDVVTIAPRLPLFGLAPDLPRPHMSLAVRKGSHDAPPQVRAQGRLHLRRAVGDARGPRPPSRPSCSSA